MSRIVGIVDYGLSGNTESIRRALRKAGAEVQLIQKPSDFDTVSHIVLPGVGCFPDAMQRLADSGLIDAIKEYAVKKPTLGICLGMQILGRVGYEQQNTEGLGLFDAETKPIICQAPVPHMGFNKIQITDECDILQGLDGESFYFMHSFEVMNYTDVAALTTYADHHIVAVIQKGTISGVQFHPEKSREQGIALLENFINS